MAGERRLVFEPLYSGGFADEFGCGQFTAALKGQQLGGDVVDVLADSSGQGVDGVGQSGDVVEFVAGQLGEQSVQSVEPVAQLGTGLGPVQSTAFGGAGRVEFMDSSQQSVDC